MFGMNYKMHKLLKNDSGVNRQGSCNRYCFRQVKKRTVRVFTRHKPGDARKEPFYANYTLRNAQTILLFIFR